MECSPSCQRLREVMESRDAASLSEFGGVTSLLASLGTDKTHGIQNLGTLATRRHKYGANSIPDLPVGSFLDMLREALSDQTLIILMLCAVLSLILEFALASPSERATAWIDGAAILVAVAIVSLVQATSNHRQELQFAAVNRIKSIFDVGVIRNGLVTQRKNIDLVVGDVVLLEAGNKVPADGVCVESDDLCVD
jgi:magnesium-transporting ATPase (P-type)